MMLLEKAHLRMKNEGLNSIKYQIINEMKGITISLNDKHCAEYIRKDEVTNLIMRFIK
jgi:hypothetical protein